MADVAQANYCMSQAFELVEVSEDCCNTCTHLSPAYLKLRQKTWRHSKLLHSQIYWTSHVNSLVRQYCQHMQVAVKPPMAVTNAVSWRSEGIKYKKNEVFLDVVESVNLLVNSNGTVVRSEVVGALKMRTFLSGMPECKLGLNDKVPCNAARITCLTNHYLTALLRLCCLQGVIALAAAQECLLNKFYNWSDF